MFDNAMKCSVTQVEALILQYAKRPGSVQAKNDHFSLDLNVCHCHYQDITGSQEVGRGVDCDRLTLGIAI